MTLSESDRQKLPRLLADVAEAVEELLLTGLTTASPATQQTLNVSFREASRMRLLRLGSTLRAASEQLGRYTANSPDFSRKQLVFFLNRAWMLCRGLSRALHEKDEEQLERLLWVPASQAVKELEVVTVGVAKKEVKDVYCAFEFRLRTTKPAERRLPEGHRLTWSCIFPVRPGTEIPAEGFLHLPQKQKFKAHAFLEGKRIAVTNCAVALDGHGGGRMSLTEESTVTVGESFTDWQSYFTWDPCQALERVRSHEPSPFDLDVELQEEVAFEDWSIEEQTDRDLDGQFVYQLLCGNGIYELVVSKGVEGNALKKSIETYSKKKNRPPLFGLMHYQMCRLVVQPLSVLKKSGPDHLMISKDKVDRVALLKTLKF